MVSKMGLQEELKQANKKIESHMEAKEALDVCISDAMGVVAKIKQQIADSEVTYSIGDRFIHDELKTKCILVRVNLTQYGIVGLDSGNYYFGKNDAPANCNRITPDELSRLYSGKITRYWDNRKQQKC
jgi:hypothetical protein